MKVTDCLSSAELKSMLVPSDFRGGQAVLFDLATIALAMAAFAAFPGVIMGIWH